MLKSIVALIASCAAVFVFFFAICTGCYLALGAERVFQPDSYEVSTLWIVLTVVISLVGPMIGGYLCAAMSKSSRTCRIFALIVFFLGLLACIPAMSRSPDAPNVRAGEVPNLQAMRLTVSPMWLHLLTPVLGAAGVLLGARLNRRPSAPLQADDTWHIGTTLLGGGVGLLVSYLLRPTIFGRGPSFEEWFTEGFNSPFAATIYTCAVIGLLVGFIIGHFIASSAKSK